MIPPDLRALLDRATAGAPPAAETVTRMKTRIDRTIAAPMTGTAVASRVIATGAGVAVALAVFIGRPRPHAPPPPPRVERALVQPAPRIETAPAPVSVPERTLVQPAPRIETAPERPRHVRVSHPPAEPPPAPAPPAPSPAPPPPAAPVVVDGAEQLLIERARDAVRHRDGGHAIEILDEHRTRFPDGALGEERDALMVQALILVGNPLAAAARAREFRARYPHSIFLDLIDAAQESP